MEVSLVLLSIHCTSSVSERTGVSELVAKALTELVERRPEDPLSFLTEQYPLLLMQMKHCMQPFWP